MVMCLLGLLELTRGTIPARRIWHREVGRHWRSDGCHVFHAFTVWNVIDLKAERGEEKPNQPTCKAKKQSHMMGRSLVRPTPWTLGELSPPSEANCRMRVIIKLCNGTVPSYFDGTAEEEKIAGGQISTVQLRDRS